MPTGLVFIWWVLRQEPLNQEPRPSPWAMLRSQAVDAMLRPRYRQDPLPLGSDTPPPELFGPEQDLPPAATMCGCVGPI